MKLGRIEPLGDSTEPLIVAVSDAAPDLVVDVRRATILRLMRSGASRAAAARIARAVVPSSMTAAIEGGERFMEAARAALDDADLDAAIPLVDVSLATPIDPPAFRDFMAFNAHFENGYRLLGTSPPEVLYELPVSYLGNHLALVGPGEQVTWPWYSEEMDYELELGFVIGQAGTDVDPATAMDHVFGFTIVNDFSARDIQFREMSGGLGPSKGKHFATAVGPWIATADELDPGSLRMQARINGETWSDGSSETLSWTPAELVAWASAAEPLATGTLLGSGTVGFGCGVEQERLLRPGDEVELEIEGVGVLANRLGPKTKAPWALRGGAAQGEPGIPA